MSDQNRLELERRGFNKLLTSPLAGNRYRFTSWLVFNAVHLHCCWTPCCVHFDQDTASLLLCNTPANVTSDKRSVSQVKKKTTRRQTFLVVLIKYKRHSRLSNAVVVFKENATSDVMASRSVRTAPEQTVSLSFLALIRYPPRNITIN